MQQYNMQCAFLSKSKWYFIMLTSVLKFSKNIECSLKL
jgi:hypothetical protein